MTKSELLASMTGSMACIAGGVNGSLYLNGSTCCLPARSKPYGGTRALVISKIVFPETEVSETKGK